MRVPVACLALLLVAPFAQADPASDARAALALRQAPLPPQAPVILEDMGCGCGERGCPHYEGVVLKCSCGPRPRLGTKGLDCPLFVPAKNKRPDGGYCSNECRCGCNEGEGCACGRMLRTAPQPHAHSVNPPVGYALPVQSYAMPAAFPAVSCGRGG